MIVREKSSMFPSYYLNSKFTISLYKTMWICDCFLHIAKSSREVTIKVNSIILTGGKEKAIEWKWNLAKIYSLSIFVNVYIFVLVRKINNIYNNKWFIDICIWTNHDICVFYSAESPCSECAYECSLLSRGHYILYNQQFEANYTINILSERWHNISLPFLWLRVYPHNIGDTANT